ncbi:hypothetical protein IC235_17285 [Hymenobacter sp. BT664]|uniref:Uncharacterized protein n=1 Tax=Hymenobacter montanus TaxID=2771359 RepID=A0A927GKZ4_9BACT|nr:hypothetical protein [Hymenobacter montanus]MBD2769646.1 hypothetical protein [Hymenobacter montanus]
MKRLRRFLHWLRPLMPYFNIGLAIAAYGANEHCVQGFCQPVPWAAGVLLASTAAFLLWPWLKHVAGLNYLLLFLMGVHFTVCLYCTYFIGPSQLLPVLLFFFLLFPMLLWVPVLFGAQAARRAWTAELAGAKAVFALGVLALVPVQCWAEYQYREIEAAVARVPPAQRHRAALAAVVPRTYMAERLAGALFKYHNYPEFIFDGWRPPLHDPLVNVSLWARSGVDVNPLQAPWQDSTGKEVANRLEEQARFYHLLFPERPLKVDCACAQIWDAEGYYDWHRDWNSPEADRRARIWRSRFPEPDRVPGYDVRSTYPPLPPADSSKPEGSPGRR